MIEHRRYASLPGQDQPWLKARHHISPAGQARESLDRWGALRAWDDDEIAPHGAIPFHAHADMEIVTYVREGVLTHRDDLGNSDETHAGDVQVMSAGTGIHHAEYNIRDSVARVFQIWIEPDRTGGCPAWGRKAFPKSERAGQFVVLASGFANDAEALPIRTRARVVGATMRKSRQLEYAMCSDRLSYVVASSGRLLVNGVRLEERDGAAIRNVKSVILSALMDTELVLVDVPA